MEDRRPISLLLLMSGITGFLLGSLQHGTWQLAVESSQVIARLVAYPADNPFYLYHSKAWTLLHQVPAIFLRLGVSERALSFALSGLLGMLSFQTLSLCTWILCRHQFLAFACPFLALFTHAHGHFVIYPIWLLGTSNSQGAISTFFIILVAALLSVHRYRAGLLLLGLAPAVHLSLGLMCWLIVAVCFWWSSDTWRSEAKRYRAFFLIGVALGLASLLFHFLFTYRLAEHSATSDVSDYLYIFVRRWDSHRVPVPYYRPGFFLNLAALGCGLLWTRKFPELLDEKAIFLMRAHMAAALLGLFFSVLSWLPVEILPSALIIMMPARILEWNVVVFPASIVGLLGRHKTILPQLALSAILVMLAVSQELSPLMVYGIVLILLILPLMLKVDSFDHASVVSHSFRVAFFLVLAFMIFRCIHSPDRFRPDPNEWNRFNLANHRDDAMWKRVTGGKGTLLTGGDLHLIQLRTRRPVLLDGGQLDLLPYTLEAAASIDRILLAVYDIDLKNPPPESIGTATIRGATNRQSWESRTATEWTALSRRFSFRQVLTYQDWRLQLPQIERSKDFALYGIMPPSMNDVP